MYQNQEECCEGLCKSLPKEELEALFDLLKPIVGARRNKGERKTHLVAISKLMHFMFPYAIPPIDRKYTSGILHFSFGPGDEKIKFIAVIEDYHNFIETNKDAFQKYCMPYRTIDMSDIKTLTWNTTAMKACDNLLIWKSKK